MARITQRAITRIRIRNSPAIEAATHGFHVASQVTNTASPSSPMLRLMFEKGSGEGVTAARAAVLPPCAIKAIVPPASVATSCSCGERPAVA
jgi:hypothetical protein